MCFLGGHKKAPVTMQSWGAGGEPLLTGFPVFPGPWHTPEEDIQLQTVSPTSMGELVPRRPAAADGQLLLMRFMVVATVKPEPAEGQQLF